jgi:hypothetical protein
MLTEQQKRVVSFAREIIEDESRWTEAAVARDAQGNPCPWWQAEATRFSATGALMKAADVFGIATGKPEYPLTLAHTLSPDLEWVNDNLGHLTVLNLFDEALAE